MSAVKKDQAYWKAVRRAADRLGPIPDETRDKIALILRGGLK